MFHNDCLHLCLPGPLHPFLGQAMLHVLESFGLDEGDAVAPEAAADAAAAGLWRRAGERVCVAPGAYSAAGDCEGEGSTVECAPR